VIANRNLGGGCPYCTGKKVLQGFNDLATRNPSLVKEWDYEKNSDLKPENFTANSGRKVWWKCKKRHTYEAQIIHRNKGGGCPYCSGKKVLQGFNDLVTRNPHLAQEWNYTLNGDLKPDHFTANSCRNVWWKCVKGHEWQTRIAHRNNGSGCPYCSKRKK